MSSRAGGASSPCPRYSPSHGGRYKRGAAPGRRETTPGTSYPRGFKSPPAMNAWLPRLLLLALAAASRGGGLAAPPPPPTPVSAQCLNAACFALFWEARSSAEAGGVCQGGGGHLMTVRSTVAAEATELLLRGRAGAAWLGLRLPEGSCAEPAKQLRGFRWVTGDENTDYEAWARTNGTGVCGPLCAVVTQELKWQERACDAPADGFFCEYSYPGGMCVPLRLPPSATASYLTPFGARESDLVAFPPGTTAEVPSVAVRLACGARGGGSSSNSSVAWRAAGPGAWDCGLENGGCEGRCDPDGAGRFSCTCGEGATLLEEDQRSCSSSCASLGCQQHCDSGVCVCSEGYVLDADGRSCKDVDDCKAHPSPCEQDCVNTQGSFECRCWSGYAPVDGKCLDEKEGCFFLTCQYDCAFVNGKYQCICDEGFVPDRRKPENCVRFCNQTECPADCDPRIDEECYCPDGYIVDYKDDDTIVCADVDECESGHCGDLECIDEPGGYHCICPDKLPVQDEKLCVAMPELPFPSPSPPKTSSPSPPKTSSPSPPKTSSSHAMLVAISVSGSLMVLGLVAILCYFTKKHHRAQTRTDFKCQQSEAGVVLQQVSPGQKL
ncbi:thrombomodulin [Elgaria multicarinata webbii]|uniref:thrombomodulin n=1 Tax=Elgaria multicarinata webbii TaxID=159646 RepID=UPI002FCD4286